MAFMRYADAKIASPVINQAEWEQVRNKATGSGMSNRLANSPSLEQFDPSRYLLTHATIVASVDVEEVPGAKTGSKIALEDGATINRKWSSYYIKPECSRFVNNNGDSWERGLLLATYHTFRGAENYQEHIQIPELSKGKIIDAVPRDIGDSVYIDILVATDRKHVKLCADIESGKMSALSMGAQVAFTICTKCGNVAADEPELCRHIKYEKGNTFFDENGKKRLIAELCGHVSDPESNVYIEASWVKNPAFKGAVLRDILKSQDAVGEAHKIQLAFSQPARMFDPSKMPKVAGSVPDGFLPLKEAFATLGYQVFAGQFDFGGPEQGGQGEEPAAPTDPLDGLIDEVKGKALDRVKSELKDIVTPPDPPPTSTPADDLSTDDSLVHSFDQKLQRAGVHETSRYRMLQAFRALSAQDWDTVRMLHCSPREIVVAANQIESLSGDLVKAVLRVGSVSNYSNAQEFISQCQSVMGRRVTSSEAAPLIKRGKLLGLATTGTAPTFTRTY